jgi:hypothetical protein
MYGSLGGSIPPHPTKPKKMQDMKVVIKVSRYDYEIIESNAVIKPSCMFDDKYYAHKDEKYKRFLKTHRFDSNPRVFDLYLRLCAENLV